MFFDVDMRNGHDGLGAILKDDKTDLKQGEVAVFINKDWTALKMLTSERVLLHLKQPNHRPIDPNAIQYLPACVNGNELDYDRALNYAVKEQYRKWYNSTHKRKLAPPIDIKSKTKRKK